MRQVLRQERATEPGTSSVDEFLAVAGRMIRPEAVEIGDFGVDVAESPSTPPAADAG